MYKLFKNYGLKLLIRIFYRVLNIQFLQTPKLLFCLSLILSSCNFNYQPPIDADDFGFPKLAIYAMGQQVTGEQENELSEWTLSGYKYNGDSITIMVYNPVNSPASSTVGTSYVIGPWLCGGVEDICQDMYTATYCNTQTNQYCCNLNSAECADVMYETFPNAPCMLQKGQGLYLLITTNPQTYPTYQGNPNTYSAINRQPNLAGFYTKGLWYDSGSYQNNEPAMGYIGSLQIPSSTNGDYDAIDYAAYDESSYVGGYAYFKFMDRYYGDNSGYYYVSLKTGFDQIIPPPIDTVMTFLTTALNSTAQTIFTQLVVESEYRNSLKAILVMYIVIHGILFLGGLLEISQREYVTMAIKLIIVIQLTTSQQSWDLFNSYFFEFFTSGLAQMIDIVTSNIPGSSDGGFSFFDSLLGLLFSYETNVKIFALIASFPCGFIAALIIYAAFFLFTIGIAQSVMIYLLASMGIDLLIIVAPIFIIFMLFKTTKPLFENWLNMFVGFFMQAVIVMAALNLMAQMIVDQIYLILGFEACYNNWIFVGSFVISKAWQICPFYNTTDIIAVPGYWTNDQGEWCTPYACTDARYVDLPFLDPSDSYQNSLIQDFKSAPGTNDLNLPMVYNASILLVMTYLMMKFNDIVPNLGKALAGGGFQSSIGDAGKAITKELASALSGIKNATLRVATNSTQEQREQAIRAQGRMMSKRAKILSTTYITDPLKSGMQTATTATKNAAMWAATGTKDAAVWAATGSANIAYKASEKVKNTVLDKATGMIKQERQEYINEALQNKTRQITNIKDQAMAGATGMSKNKRSKITDSVKKRFSISKESQEIITKTAISTGRGIFNILSSITSSTYKAAKAVAPTSMYSLGGFIKDMIIPPGSLMGVTYNVNAAEDYNKKLQQAKKTLWEFNVNEGADPYDYKTHRQKLSDMFKSIKIGGVSIADIEAGAAAFDKENKDRRERGEGQIGLGYAVTKSITKAGTKQLGKLAYKTELGKWAMDGVAERGKQFRDSVRNSLEDPDVKLQKALENQRKQQQEINQKVKEKSDIRTRRKAQRQVTKGIIAKERDLCEALGIKRSELVSKSFEEQQSMIEKAYRKAALKCHPDKNLGKEAEAAEAFKKISAIRDSLLESLEKRKESAAHRAKIKEERDAALLKSLSAQEKKKDKPTSKESREELTKEREIKESVLKQQRKEKEAAELAELQQKAAEKSEKLIREMGSNLNWEFRKANILSGAAAKDTIIGIKDTIIGAAGAIGSIPETIREMKEARTERQQEKEYNKAVDSLNKAREEVGSVEQQKQWQKHLQEKQDKKEQQQRTTGNVLEEIVKKKQKEDAKLAKQQAMKAEIAAEEAARNAAKNDMLAKQKISKLKREAAKTQREIDNIVGGMATQLKYEFAKQAAWDSTFGYAIKKIKYSYNAWQKENNKQQTGKILGKFIQDKINAELLQKETGKTLGSLARKIKSDKDEAIQQASEAIQRAEKAGLNEVWNQQYNIRNKVEKSIANSEKNEAMHQAYQAITTAEITGHNKLWSEQDKLRREVENDIDKEEKLMKRVADLTKETTNKEKLFDEKDKPLPNKKNPFDE